MPCSPTFVDLALDLLSSVGPVDARRMFGGYGIYARGVMFGLLDDDELFLKTDLESRERFVAAGCRMWVYPGAGGGETSYYRPPDDAHEDAEGMAAWARLGLDAALRLRAAKRAAEAARAARRADREAARARKASKAPEVPRTPKTPPRVSAKVAPPATRKAGPRPTPRAKGPGPRTGRARSR